MIDVFGTLENGDTMSAPELANQSTTVDGVNVKLNGLGTVEWREDCATCQSIGRGGFGPSHTASTRCESGQHAHCTCDTCF